MSIGDDLKEVVGPKYRHDVSVVVVAVLAAWAAFAFNGRLVAAENKAELAVTMQKQVQELTTNQAIMKAQLSDTDANVKLLVAAMLGPQAVIHHPDPPPKQR